MTTTLLSLVDAAQLLGVPRNTLARWARQGRIPSIQRGSQHMRWIDPTVVTPQVVAGLRHLFTRRRDAGMGR